MKTKNKPKQFILGLICGALIISATPTIAKSTKETIKVIYNNLELYVNGREVSDIEPFIFNGTTYVPVKSVAEALGQPISTQGNKIYIGTILDATTSNKTVDLIDFVKDHPFYDRRLAVDSKYKDTSYVEIQQQKYPITNVVTSPHTGNVDVLFLNGEYKTLKACIGIDDRRRNAQNSNRLTGFAGFFDKDTNEELYTTNGVATIEGKSSCHKGIGQYASFGQGDIAPIEVEIDVTNVKRLQVEISSYAMLYNVKLERK